MNIIDIVEAINDKLAKLPNDATYFYYYLRKKACTAFETDHTLFVRHDVFSRLENITLMRILAKCILQAYDDKFTHKLDMKKESLQRVSEETLAQTQNSSIEGAAPPAAIEDAVPEVDSVEKAPNQGAIDQEP